MKKLKLIILIAFIIISLTVLFYSGEVPYKIRVTGKISPGKEWIVARGDGLITSTLYDNITGKTESYFVSHFERGDAVQFKLNESIIPGASISKGDTIAWIDSRDIERQFVQLNGELKTQKALLTSLTTGDKKTIIEEAKRRVDHTIEAFEEQQRIVERLEQLSNTGIIPYQEYEVSRSNLKLFSINVDIAEAQLQTVQSGVKQEEIEVIVTRINALEKNIKALLALVNDYTLTSPISGIVFETSSADTLVDIGDVTEVSVIIPIKLVNRQYINPNQDVECKIIGSNDIFHGKILKLGNIVHVVNGEQVIIVTASIKTENRELLPGTIMQCIIICEPVTSREYLKRLVN